MQLESSTTSGKKIRKSPYVRREKPLFGENEIASQPYKMSPEIVWVLTGCAIIWRQRYPIFGNIDRCLLLAGDEEKYQ